MVAPDEERQLHRYELVDRIAVGGMAEVFRAKAFGAHGFEKSLAIKRILPDLAQDPEFEARFIAEAKLAVALTHANIVQVFDFGRFGGSLFIAMEYVDGPDLAGLIKTYGELGRPFPVGPALHVTMELCKGLDFAHRRGVVHRDVSPSNILISRAGEVKIADFGIAQAAAEAEAARSGSRRIMGKWRYMSPEQARGEPLTPRSDLFSAGACVFELFTGRKLFPGDSSAEILNNVCEMPIPRPSSVRGDLPPTLDDVLGRALERDPDRRFKEASELLRALVELSYSRTLVASAFDVAEVVATAFPPAPPSSGAPDASARLIDDIIRSELERNVAPEEPTGSRVTVRQTAPGMPVVPAPLERTGDTGLSFVRRAGDGGVSVWEVAGAPAPGPAPGGTPTPLAPVPTTPTGRAGPSRVAFLMAGGALAIAVVVALWVFVVRRGDTPSAVALPPDAGPEPAVIRVESIPPGAAIELDGRPFSAPTNADVSVEPGRPHAITVKLGGYRVWRRDGVVARAGEKVVIDATLERPVTHLEVRSDPAGAEVWLDATRLGETPYAGDVVADGRAHTLTLRKAKHPDVAVPVELTDGASIPIDRRLGPSERFGFLNLHVEPWAYVYLGGKKIAEAPVAGLKLPAGRHKLVLDNPKLGRKTTLIVDIPANGTVTKTVSLL